MKKLFLLLFLLLLAGCSNVPTLNPVATSTENLGVRTDDTWNRIGSYVRSSQTAGENVLFYNSSGIRYTNFGTVSGSTGYGIRNNSGAMEYKNSGGAWAGIGSGTGGEPLWRAASSSYLTLTGDFKGTWDSLATTSIPTTASSSKWNAWFHASSSKIGLTNLSSSATGLTYTNTTGDFSLTSGYNIPLTASTSKWNELYHASSTLAGGTPGGSDTQIQFNDGGSLGGSSFYYDKNTKTTVMEGLLAFASQTPQLLTGSERVQFEDETGVQSDWSFRVASDGYGAINFGSSGGTLDNPITSVINGFPIGSINFYGHDGHTYNPGSTIFGLATGLVLSGGYQVIASTTPGLVSIQNPATNFLATFQPNLLTSANRIFTFPDKDGIFAMTSDLDNIPMASTTLTAGTGLDLDTNTINTDFNEYTGVSALLSGDYFPLWQDTAGDEKKISWSDLKSEMYSEQTLTAGSYLCGGSDGKAEATTTINLLSKSFAVASSTYLFSAASSTIPLGYQFYQDTWSSIACKFIGGATPTAHIVCGDGTNNMEILNINGTMASTTLATNNVLQIKDQAQCVLEAVVNNPDMLTCNISYRRN